MFNYNSGPKRINEFVFLTSEDSADFDLPIVIDRPRGIQISLSNEQDSPEIYRHDAIAAICFDEKSRKLLAGISLEALPSLIRDTFIECSTPSLRIYLVCNGTDQLNDYLDSFDWDEVVSNIRTSSNCFVIEPQIGIIYTEIGCDALGDVTLRYLNCENGNIEERRITDGWNAE